jgi:hypothetical protein
MLIGELTTCAEYIQTNDCNDLIFTHEHEDTRADDST